MRPRFATLIGLSLLAAAAWWYALDFVAWLAGRVYRRHRPAGAIELLDAAL